MLERITRRERSDLLIAWLAISIAFSLIFIRGGVTVELFVIYLLVSMLTVGIGFILHEMAHKFTAMKYGFWAEFRKDNLMLLVAVAMAALVGVVFAAPGATVIYGGYISREQNGKISAAGPAVNLLLCIPFALILFLSGMFSMSFLSRNLLALIGMVGLQVNAMIAAFNMLPVSVLDGKKVLAWNPAVFAVLIITAFGLLLASFYPAIF
ncbi:MAG TPA: peptidase M50 [Methanolinea sp.]|nr:peptidase M50 [Methanolinea sp.]HQK56377.1 peptidase M50 [Methanolinea sp.]